MSGSSSVDAVDTLLQDRTHTLSTLKANLLRAQHRMKTQADAKRTDISFHEDDWVFLKLQPYRQRSLTGHSTHKLSKRFFGPFKILQKIGPVAYRLALPNTAQLHDVFHVSKLKRCVGDPSIQQLPLPSEFQNDRPVAQPAEIINSQFIIYQGQHLRQLLVRWENQGAIDATWETEEDLRRNFPRFHLEDKVVVGGGGHM